MLNRRLAVLGAGIVPPRIAIIAFAATLTGCSIFDGPVEVRVRNESTVDFTSVRVIFPDDVVEYGALARNAASDYHEVGEAYGYAYVEAQAGSVTYIQQPIDYVGEEKLEGGKYTYVLTIIAPGRVSTRLEVD